MEISILSDFEKCEYFICFKHIRKCRTSKLSLHIAMRFQRIAIRADILQHAAGVARRKISTNN